MIKPFTKYINKCFAEWMKKNHPKFRKTKIKAGDLIFNTGNIFELTIDTKRHAWIFLGGERDSQSLIALLTWTTEGTPLESIDLWDPRNPSVPKSGIVQLTDERIVGDDLPLDGMRLLIIGDPSTSLREAAIQETMKTEIYKKSRELTAKRMRQHNPLVTDEEINAEKTRANQILSQTWSYINDANVINEDTIPSILDPLLNKIHHLINKYGIPFLEDQLKQD